jgi:hypothetical protein
VTDAHDDISLIARDRPGSNAGQTEGPSKFGSRKWIRNPRAGYESTEMKSNSTSRYRQSSDYIHCPAM